MVNANDDESFSTLCYFIGTYDISWEIEMDRSNYDTYGSCIEYSFSNGHQPSGYLSLMNDANGYHMKKGE